MKTSKMIIFVKDIHKYYFSRVLYLSQIKNGCNALIFNLLRLPPLGFKMV